jgi:hypothetical protein
MGDYAARVEVVAPIRAGVSNTILQAFDLLKLCRCRVSRARPTRRACCWRRARRGGGIGSRRSPRRKNCICDPHHTLSDDDDVMNVAVCGGVTRRTERGYHVQSHVPLRPSVQPTGESRHRDGCVRARRARWRRRGLVVHAVLNRPVARRDGFQQGCPRFSGVSHRRSPSRRDRDL